MKTRKSGPAALAAKSPARRPRALTCAGVLCCGMAFGDAAPAAPGPVEQPALLADFQTDCLPGTQSLLELNLGFGPRVPLTMPGGQPRDLLLVDLDGDGRNDLVSANASASAFVVFRNLTPEGGNLGPGTFAAPLGFGTADSTPTLAAVDLDGDGKPEVIVNPRSLGALQVFRNTSTPGTLAFAAPVLVANGFATPGGSSTAVAVADLDRDGAADLIVVNSEDGEVACYRNTSVAGTLAFEGRQTFPVGARPWQVAVGDLDGDGRVDLAVANLGPAFGLTLVRNTSSPGSIAFAGAPVTFTSPSVLASVAVADLDRDGKPEVFGAAPVLGGVAIWRNTSQVGVLSADPPSSLAEPLLVATSCAPIAVAAAETDGDGFPDLAVVQFGPGSVALLGNQSTPGHLDFRLRGEFPTGLGPLTLALADLNGDRRPDLAVADVLAGDVHLRQNRWTWEGGGPIPFTIGGAAPPTTGVSVTARSANEGLIPDENLLLLGSGAQRTLVVTPLPGVSGVARITVRVQDGANRVVENEVVLLVGCTRNTVWPEACELGLAEDAKGELHATVQQSLDQAGEGRWYRFKAQPESQLYLILSGLPDNYDLFLFQDIRAAYEEITGETLTTGDLVALNARYAPAAYSPAAYSPAAYSPMVYSPAAYSPAAYSPAAYSPMVYSPAAYSPAAYSPMVYSPAAYSPAAYSDDAFAPAAYSPAAYSGPVGAPVAFSPAAYSGAQTRSLLAASAFDGTANEGIFMNTWTSTGDFYVCVRGRDGAFSENQPFRLDVHLVPGGCGSLDTSSIPASTTVATKGPEPDGYQTLILADFARLNRPPDPALAASWAADVAALRAKLDTLAARPEVQGVVVDLATDPAVVAANQLADQAYDCVFAKNVAARLIQDIVARFRALNPALEYLVLVGGDDVIPNFRYPDNTPLGAEQNFIVPVRDATSSQATLRLGYFMSQDAYGAACELPQKLTRIPLAKLATGRLVETPAEITGQLDAYLALPGGRLPPATSSLVTGYEFLADVAEAVEAELRAGIGEDQGQVHDALIAPASLAPGADPATTANWSAQELAQVLFGRRHDVMFLAGHYNDGSALAADYETELTARELVESPVNLEHSVVFGAGCHVGYNTVDRHAMPGVTQDPDWAQAMARKRATLIGGWGYQYGDTELLEYSERLYLNFARQLRQGSPGGTVPVGQALVAAKRQYLEETGEFGGIHEKALLEVALFGLPMLRVDLPHKANPAGALERIVSSTETFTTDPGHMLGLSWADVTIPTSPLSLQTRSLGLYDDNGNLTGSVLATYLEGAQGSASHPAEPVLPVVVKDASPPSPGPVLRGVGFRGGTYTDEPNVRQLTGTPATEFRGSVVAFQSLVFHPVQPWSVNYFGALCSDGNTTRLNLFPAQYRTDPAQPELGTRRTFAEMRFRLYYSGNVATYTKPPGENPDTPALADAPTIVEVTDEVAGNLVTITASVVGNPAAGMQEVWVSYTAEDAPWLGVWQALDLVQDSVISSRWSGTLVLPAGLEASAVRYAVQAVNGVGLVTMNANRGAFFTPGAKAIEPVPTTLTLDGFALTGRYGDTATFSAVLAKADGPVAGQLVQFGLGIQQAQAFTDANGRATVRIQLQGLPTQYALQVAFGGAAGLASASASTGFEIQRQPTAIRLEDLTTTRPNLNVVAWLADGAGRQIAEKSVFFVLTDNLNAVRLSRAVITDHAGRASLGIVPLEAGTYFLRVYFNDRVPLPAGGGSTELVGTWQLDPRYEPALQTGTYAFELVAVNATIFRAPGRSAKLNIASLLQACRGLSAPLSLQSVQAATPGDASVSTEDGWILYTPPSNDEAPGSFTYTITDGSAATATGSVQVLLLPEDPSPTTNILFITENPDGSMQLRFIGIPGLQYTIQAKESLDVTVPWTNLGTRVAGPNGVFEFTDTNADEYLTRYYRAVGP